MGASVPFFCGGTTGGSTGDPVGGGLAPRPCGTVLGSTGSLVKSGGLLMFCPVAPPPSTMSSESAVFWYSARALSASVPGPVWAAGADPSGGDVSPAAGSAKGGGGGARYTC